MNLIRKDFIVNLLENKEEINKAIIKRLNELISLLETDYKEISNILDYSDFSYIHRVLKGKKVIEVSTLFKISKALIEINKIKNIINDEKILYVSEIIKSIGH